MNREKGVHKSSSLIFGIVFLSVFAVACNQESTTGEMKVNDAPIKSASGPLEQVSAARVYFGHQSVGDNILQGIRQLDPSGDIRIVERHDGTVVDRSEGGVFWQSKIGTNGEPLSKLREFRSVLDQGIGNSVDIAVFKFCYLDIIRTTDVKTVFDDYKNTMLELRRNFEGLTIVHTTVPLQVNPEGWKTKIKKLLGKGDLWEYQDNIVRMNFNRMLLAEYDGVAPVFDLAEVESTKSDGSRETFALDGVTYYALAPEYTVDGSHLNALGQRQAARRLIEIIAGIPD